MKIINKMSYAVCIYEKATCSTVGFYELTGADYKDVLPQILAFNRATAGKVEVQDPVPWGEARKDTWRAIVTNRLVDDDNVYAHLTPDGANMSDYDVFDYWRCCEGAEGGSHTSRQQSKEDFIRHLDKLVVKTALEDDGLSGAEKKAVVLMDEARKAAEVAAAAMEKAAEASKAAMAECGRMTKAN